MSRRSAQYSGADTGVDLDVGLDGIGQPCVDAHRRSPVSNFWRLQTQVYKWIQRLITVEVVEGYGKQAGSKLVLAVIVGSHADIGIQLQIATARQVDIRRQPK